MTAIGVGGLARTTPGRTDPVRQQLAVRQAGHRVVQRAALGRVEQPGVVERDRGELGEADEGSSRGCRSRDRASPRRGR